MLRSALTCLASLSIAGLSSAGVLVVSPGGPFTSIAVAVGAASDGDVVLVKAGSYGGFTVSNKSLVIVADTGAVVNVGGRIAILGLASDKECLISGLRVTAQSFDNEALDVENCLGSVRVQDALLQSTPDMCDPNGQAVHVHASTDVVFSKCELRGASAPLPTTPSVIGRKALFLTNAPRVLLHDTLVVGGNSGMGTVCLEDFPDGMPGQNGVTGFLTSGGTLELWAAHSTFRGGDGGSAQPPGSGLFAGSGGTGIVLSSPPSPGFFATLGLMDCILQGGSAGPSPPGSPGSNGTTLSISPSAMVSQTLPAGPARLLDLPAVVRGGQTLTLHFQGVAGDVAAAVFAGTGTWQPDPVSGWVRTVAGPGERFQRYGVVPASGVLDVAFTIARHPPGLDAVVYQVQSVHRATSGQYVLGTPRFFVAVKPGL